MRSCNGAKHLGAVLLAMLAGAFQAPAQAAFPDLEWSVNVEAIGLAGAVAPDGSVWDASQDADCIVLTRRAATTGNEQWSRFLCGDRRLPLATLNVDSSGNGILLWRFATGTTMFAGKYQPDGTVVWERAVTEEPDIAPVHAAVDPSGNIFVAGFAFGSSQSYVAKLAVATGVVAWRANFAFASVLVVSDSAGNAIVGERNDSTRVAAVTKRDAALGGIVWRKQFDNAGVQRFPGAIAVDASDNLVVTGGLQSRPGDTAFTTLVMSGVNGAVFWRRELPDGISTDSYGTSVGIDGNGDIAVAGRTATAKYLADSTLIWQVNTQYTGDPLLAIDANNDIVVTSVGAAGTQDHIRTNKYAGADGRQIWTIGYADGPQINAAHFGLAAAPTGPVVFGTSLVDRHNQLRVLKYSSDPVATRNYQGLWWNAPANSESGWGLNVAHQGDVLFLTWFTYDLNGDPMWLVVPEAREAFGQTYSGTLYRTTGPRFDSVPFNPAAVNVTVMGTVYIDFTDASNGTFRYDFGPNGPIGSQYSKTKPITRQVFDARVPVCSPGPASGVRSYQDLWWASPPGSESGWGVNLTHQGDILFATWFTYDANGRGMWIVGPRLEKTPAGTYAGPLYRTRGPTFASVPWPASVTIAQVGTGTFTFADPDHGSFAYTVDGTSQAKPIVRQQFGTPATNCVFAPTP